MFEIATKDLVVAILATLFLGALGSGIWDIAFRPLLAKFSNFLFNIVTLGVKNTRDRVYARASRGFHELPSLYILLISILTIVVIFFALITIFDLKYLDFLNNCTDIENCFNNIEFENLKTIENEILLMENEIKLLRISIFESLNNKFFQIYILSLHISGIVFSILILRLVLTVNKINMIITYFEHCLNSLGTSLTEIGKKKIRQKFAQMESEEDFENLITTLNKVAESKNIKLPKRYA